MTATRFTSNFSERERAIRRELATSRGPVTDVGRGHWRVTPAAGSGQPVDVRLRDGWAVCCSPIERPFEGPVAGLERYLRVNSRLGWRCKVVLDPALTPALRVREDIPVVEGVDVARECDGAVDRVAAARVFLARPRRPARREDDTAPLPAGVCEAVEQASAAIGFGHQLKDAASNVVTWDGPAGQQTATVRADASGGVCVAAVLSRHRSPSSVGRRALAVFLLTANGLIRFARGGIRRTGRATEPFFEVRFNETSAPALVEAALSALAAACGAWGREMSVLTDEAVARCYLNARGGAGATAGRKAATPRQKSPEKSGETAAASGKAGATLAL
jgi:hypothetical protein